MKFSGKAVWRYLFRFAAALAAAVAVSVIIAGFGFYTHPTVTEKTLVRLEKALDADCRASKVSIRPWGTIKIDSLTITGGPSGGGLYTAVVEEVQFAFRFFGLLFNYSRPEKPVESIIYRMKFSGCAVKGNFVRGVLFSLDEAEGRISLGAGEMHGKLTGASVVLGNGRLSDCRAQIALENSLLKIEDFRARGYGGRIQSSAVYDMKKRGLAKGSLKASGVDLQELYAGFDNSQGSVSGTAAIRLKVSSTPLSLKHLKGGGTMTVRELRTRDVPLQKTLVVALFMPSLSDILFKKVDISYRLADGRIYTDGISADGDTLDFTSSGTVEYHGAFRQEFEGVLSQEFGKSLRPVIRRSLTETEKGEYSFGCTIWGTFADPRVELDKKILRRAVKNVFDDIGRGIRSIFKD
ncbi:MAG: hypothetical protein GF350_10090 [Chitinivibrionales bacterium]|nr:hypothetical protein [Chitinivibrionales bacterium]